MSCIYLRHFLKSFTSGKRQLETSIQSTNVDQKSMETGQFVSRFFDCHLSPDVLMFN